MQIKARGTLRCRRIVVVEHGVPRAVEIVELASLECQPEDPAGQEYERDGEGNE